MTLDPQSPTPADDRPVPFVGHALVVGALTLVSRLTGLIRDAVLVPIFGLVGGDPFFVSFLVPNLFRRLFGEGALSAAFIPHYAELRHSDPLMARRFASACLLVLAVGLGVLVLSVELVLAGFLGFDWGGETALAIRLTMVMLLYMPLVCLVALIGGVLQVHSRFSSTASAPILLNLTMILFAVWAWWGGLTSAQMARWIAVGVVVAGVGQLIWQVVPLLRCTSLTFDWRGTAVPVRSMLRMMVPMFAGLAVFQINVLLDSLIAFGFSAKEAGIQRLELMGLSLPFPIQSGSVTALQCAQRLYQFPLGVFGIALATAIFPALAGAAADRSAQFGEVLRQGLRLSVFIGLPASLGLILVRVPLVRTVFERLAFEPTDTDRVATILVGYAVGVWAYSITHVLTRAFYACKNTAVPLKISMAMVGLNLVLNLTLIWWIGAAGLAWSTSLTAIIQAVLLLVALRRHVSTPVDSTVLRSWIRTVVLTGLMVAVLWPIVAWYDSQAQNSLAAGLLLVTVAIGGAAIVLGGAWLSGAEEVRWLLRLS